MVIRYPYGRLGEGIQIRIGCDRVGRIPVRSSGVEVQIRIGCGSAGKIPVRSSGGEVQIRIGGCGEKIPVRSPGGCSRSALSGVMAVRYPCGRQMCDVRSV